MGQKQVSAPLQKNPQNEYKNGSKNSVNYLNKQYRYFSGIKQNMWFFQPQIYTDDLISFYPFSKNRQIKIIKKQKIGFGVLSFMNKSNQIIIQNSESINIWQLNNQFTWSLSKTIVTFRKEKQENDEFGTQILFESYENFHKFQCHELNASEDLLVVQGNCNNIKFFQKTTGDNWICIQKIESLSNNYRKFKFNGPGTLLISYVEPKFRLIIFHRNYGQWKVIREIETQIDCPFCFLGNQIFAMMMNDLVISLWKVASYTQKVSKFQDLNLLPSNTNLLYGYRSLNYLQSNDTLIGCSLGYLYLIKKSKKEYFIHQIFQISHDPVEVIHRNKGELQLQNQVITNEFNQFKISFQRTRL